MNFWGFFFFCMWLDPANYRNIYWDNYSCKTAWGISKVSLQHHTSLICSLKLCLRNEAKSAVRMSLLVEEFIVSDLILSQEARNGKWGEMCLNNEVKVIEVNRIPVSVAFQCMAAFCGYGMLFEGEETAILTCLLNCICSIGNYVCTDIK